MSADALRTTGPPADDDVLLRSRDLVKHFPVQARILFQRAGRPCTRSTA